MSGQLEFDDEDRSTTLSRAWDLSLRMLATKVSKVTYETSIRPAQPISYEGNVVTIGVTSPFMREWIEKKASNAIRSALEFHLDASGIQLRFVLLTKEQQRQAETNTANAKKPETSTGQPPNLLQPALPLDEDGEAPQTPLSNQSQAPATPVYQLASPAKPTTRKPTGKTVEPEVVPIPSLPFNEKYTFDTFLIGRSNRLAHAGSISVADKPGEVYNPLFLYGGPGLGKTHLLHGIGNTLHKTRPDLRVAYVSGEYFAQHYIRALREHATEEFRRQYRAIDVWLVDDIQFIAGKEHTNEEFFHTFNTLYQSGRQIVIASDRSPRELNTMDERLRSRFQSGLIADIGAPDFETRFAILQQFRHRERVKVADDVLSYIASAIQSNIRALEGALTRLIAYSSIMNAPMSAELASNVLGEYFIEKPVLSRKLTPEMVVDAVAEKCGIAASAILGNGRDKDVVLARHIAMHLCREILPEVKIRVIGGMFGGRDHTAIIHACKRLKDRIDLDPDLQQLLRELTKLLTK